MSVTTFEWSPFWQDHSLQVDIWVSGTTQSQNGIFSSHEVTGVLVDLTAKWISCASIPIRTLFLGKKKKNLNFRDCQAAD